ncbi:MAG TPA: hypothetical protein VFD71_01000 [Planctomycetota bacterium]|nr:hypothetical protein [Planctomycetota bacterium]
MATQRTLRARALAIGLPFLCVAAALRADDAFRRGDANIDGAVDIADVQTISESLQGPGALPPCSDGRDADDNGKLEQADALWLFNYFYRGAESPPTPGTVVPGQDPTSDKLPPCSYAPSSAPVPGDVSFSFDDPGALALRPGERFNMPVRVFLTTENGTDEGPGAWSIAVRAEGAELDAIALEGIEVATDYYHDDDGDPATPPVLIEDHPVFLHDLPAVVSGALEALASEPKPGAYAAVFLGGAEKVVLPPQGTQLVGWAWAKGVVHDDSGPISLHFVDGLLGPGGYPIENLVSLRGASKKPALHSITIPVEVQPGPSYVLGFAGLPATASGRPGEHLSFEVDATLSTLHPAGAKGVQGWSISLGVEGGKIEAIALSGVVVSTVYFQKNIQDPNQPPIRRDPVLVDLGAEPNPGFRKANLGFFFEDPQRLGAASTVIVNQFEEQWLQPEGTQAIARLTVTAEVGDVERELRLYYEDGIFAQGSHMSNAVTSEGASYIPVLRSVSVPILSLPRIPFRLGDTNADGRQDLSDAVNVLNFLFQGGREPQCMKTAELNGDGRVDLSDPLFLLGFLFLHSSFPREPYRSCDAIDPPSDSLSCDSYPPCAE